MLILQLHTVDPTRDIKKVARFCLKNTQFTTDQELAKSATHDTNQRSYRPFHNSDVQKQDKIELEMSTTCQWETGKTDIDPDP